MQLQVYRIGSDRLVVDLQSDFIDIGTRVVAPLISIREGAQPISRLEPVFQIGLDKYALRVGDLAAVPSKLLATPAIFDLSRSDYEIRRAVELVFTGF